MDQESLIAGITASVTHYPHKTAIKSETRLVSYYELERKSNRLANFMYGKIRNVPHIVIILDRSPELIEAIIGVLKCGFVFVPLSPEFPENRVRQMIYEAQAEWVITSHEYYGKFKGIFSDKGNDPRLKILLIDAGDERNDDRGKTFYLSSQLESEILLFDRVPKENCYIYFTSGSTGVPKAVLGRRLGLNHFIQWEMNEFDVDQSFNVSQLTPPSFDPFLRDIFVPLMAGGTSCIPSSEILMSSGKMIRWIDESNITLMHTVPSFFKRLSSAVEDSDCFNNLKYILLAGELLRGRDISRFLEIFKDRIQLVNIYGPTETTLAKLFYRIKPEDVARSVIPVGKPIDGAQVLILDSKKRKSRRGKKGELYIRTPFLSSGYYNDPELTDKVFIKNPFGKLQNDIIYKTGDLGRLLPDENIELSGRVDLQVKIRGVRIELGEIENRLLAYKDIQEAVVTVRNDPGDDSYLCAYLVANIEEKIESSVLRKYLSGDLPDFMIPSFFIFLEQFPLLYNGKIDRSRLPDPRSAGTNIEEGTYLAPKSDIEKQIAGIWKEVLQLKKISTNSNFFDLGGNSLKIMEVESKLCKEYKREIPLAKLFEYSTISSLAEFIGGIEAEKDVPGSRGRGRSVKKSDVKGKKGTRQSFPIDKKLDRKVNEVAVVGMACRFPGARDVQEFWDILREGRETISFFSNEEILASGIDRELANHPDYVKAASQLTEKEFFDAFFFKYTPKEAELLEPQVRIFHECAWKALEDSCIVPDFFEGLIGVFAGAVQNLAWPTRALLSGKSHSIGEFAAGKLTGVRYLCTRLSYNLNLKGPSVTIQTACSTSLVAVHMACRALIEGECDAALAGGVTASPEDRVGYVYEDGMIFSSDGHCRAFDARGNGTIFGEGVGVVVLKRLDEALEVGDHIYAVVKGSAINNDGNRKVGFTAPSVKGQVEVIRSALDRAGIESGSIDYVETHGTATKMGDSIEIEALVQVFNTGKKKNCRIGSVKSNFGHLDAAAGIAGFIKTVLALKYRFIPPSLHFEFPNPGIKFAESPFVVNNSLMEWKSDGNPLRAGVSSMGMGGTNAHVILEEAPGRREFPESRKYHIVLLSAESENSLSSITTNMAEFLKSQCDVNFADVVYTLQTGRKRFKNRLMCVSSDKDEAAKILSGRNETAMDSSSRLSTYHSSIDHRPVIFMLPGQGSQYVNMGRELYETEPLFKDEINRCLEILESLTGRDLKSILYPSASTSERKNPGNLDKKLKSDLEEQINRTEVTQPIIFAFEYSLAQLLKYWGIVPYAMIGHSIGEYVAACLSNVISLEDALRLVVLRGKLMQKVENGAMLSVPLPDQELLPHINERLALAAVNSTSSCVVSGTCREIEKFEQSLKEKGHESRRLKTSCAFHSSLMEAILPEFEEEIRRFKFKQPNIPYVSNLTGQWITREEVTDPQYWSRHLRRTVLFSRGLEQLFNEEHAVFIEVGPGNALNKFAKNHSGRSSTHIIMNLIKHPQERVSDIYYLMEKIGRLWLYGQEIDWRSFYAEEKRFRLSLPTYVFDRQYYWIDEVELSDLKGRGTIRKREDITDWFYIPSWKRSVILPEAQAGSGRMYNLIFIDSTGLGAEIIEKLEENREETIQVKTGVEYQRESKFSYVINPESEEDYEKLFQALIDSGFVPDRVVHMWGVADDRSRFLNLKKVGEAQEVGFYSLINIARVFGRLMPQKRCAMTIITNNMQQVIGNENLAPEKATILGPVRVIPQEYTHIFCRSIDIVLPEDDRKSRQRLVDSIYKELTHESPDIIVAFRENQRWIPLWEPVKLNPLPGVSVNLKPDRTYLITGGLGGIGLVLAEYLAEVASPRLILTGLRYFPDKEDWQSWLAEHDSEDEITQKIKRLKAIEKLGAQVHILQVDVSDQADMARRMEEVESRYGEISGIIHAAGVVDSAGVIYRRDRRENEKIFSPKLHGTLVLNDLLGERNLDFFILCSSLNALFPPVGLVGIASANAFLDAFARYKTQNSNIIVLSINWDSWREVGMTEKRLEKSGQNIQVIDYGIFPEEGMDVFGRAMGHEFSNLVVSTLDLDARLTLLWSEGRLFKYEDRGFDTSLPNPTARLETLPFKSASKAEEKIKEIWQELLGHEKIGTGDNFFELGGDSLTAVEIRRKMKDLFNIDIPLVKVFQYPTIRSFVKSLIREDDSNGKPPFMMGNDNGMEEEESIHDVLEKFEGV